MGFLKAIPISTSAQAYEALGGTWKPAASSAAAAAPDAAGDAPPTDIAAALAAEVAEVKEGSKQALFYHTVGMHSVVFVECKDPQGPSPTALVQHVCAAVDASRVNSTRWCNRFYPIEHTCYASMEKIEELAAAVAAEHFPEGGEQIEVRLSVGSAGGSGVCGVARCRRCWRGLGLPRGCQSGRAAPRLLLLSGASCHLSPPHFRLFSSAQQIHPSHPDPAVCGELRRAGGATDAGAHESHRRLCHASAGELPCQAWC